MGRFQGLSGVRTNSGGLYFLPGDYLVDIDEVKYLRTRKEKDVFIIGATVVTSTNPERPAGCRPSQVIAIRQDILATCMGNVKQFAGAVLGLSDPDTYEADDVRPRETAQQATDRFWDEALEALVSDAQPARGVRLRLSVTNIKTKAGSDFGKHIWSQPTA